MGIAERAKHLNLSSGELSVKEKRREEELNSQSAEWMAFGLLPHDIDKKRFIVVAEESFQRHITDAEFNDWAVDVLSSRTDVEQKWSQKAAKALASQASEPRRGKRTPNAELPPVTAATPAWVVKDLHGNSTMGPACSTRLGLRMRLHWQRRPLLKTSVRGPTSPSSSRAAMMMMTKKRTSLFAAESGHRHLCPLPLHP